MFSGVARLEAKRRALPIFRSSPRRAERLQAQLTKLLPLLRLAVVYGGDKHAHQAVINQTGNPRSWKSYENVARDIADAMARLGCGYVTLLPDDMQLGHRLLEERIHVAWLNTGGVQGLCSIAHAASMLEMFGVPYVGHDPSAAAALDNKHHFKRHLMALGIPTAPFLAWHPKHSPADPTADPRFLAMFPDCESGFIVKPVSGRASLHVHYVEHPRDVALVAHEVAAATGNPVLIEKFLPGDEYCIAVCGPLIARGGQLEHLDEPFSFAAIQRVLSKDEFVFTSMDVRPITQQRMRLLSPEADANATFALTKLAGNLYTAFPLQTLVRLDIRADKDGRLFVLEANPKPDLKKPDAAATSLICAGLDSHAMSYDDLILSIFAGRMAALLDGEGAVHCSIAELIRD
jgi:D-alanine-D-alanine ligase